MHEFRWKSALLIEAGTITSIALLMGVRSPITTTLFLMWVVFLIAWSLMPDRARVLVPAESPASFPAMLPYLDRWVKSVDAHAVTSNSDIREALRAIARAANATKVYLAVRREHPHMRELPNLHSEHDLSDLWERAGIELADINADLAERCLLKAQYWADPQGWISPEPGKSQIGLEKLYRDARKVLLKAHVPEDDPERPVPGV